MGAQSRSPTRPHALIPADMSGYKLHHGLENLLLRAIGGGPSVLIVLLVREHALALLGLGVSQEYLGPLI